MTELEKNEPLSLDTLAQMINVEHRAFIGSARKTLKHGIRAGELLKQAKSQCRHGEWLGWLDKNFVGAPRTAQSYMQLHKNHQYEQFKSKPEFIGDQLVELVGATTARYEDIPTENPLPDVLDDFEWRQVLAHLEHKRDEGAAGWVEAYAKAGKGTNFDMRRELGYVLRHAEYADIRRLEEDAKILREAGRSYAALADALERGMKERAQSE